MRCPKEGTRVRIRSNAVSRLMYSPGHLPKEGSAGTVTTVPLGGRRATCMAGPGGGLIYVKFDDGNVAGVSKFDLVKEKSGAGFKGASRRRRRR